MYIVLGIFLDLKKSMSTFPSLTRCLSFAALNGKIATCSQARHYLKKSFGISPLGERRLLQVIDSSVINRISIALYSRRNDHKQKPWQTDRAKQSGVQSEHEAEATRLSDTVSVFDDSNKNLGKMTVIQAMDLVEKSYPNKHLNITENTDEQGTIIAKILAKQVKQTELKITSMTADSDLVVKLKTGVRHLGKGHKVTVKCDDVKSSGGDTEAVAKAIHRIKKLIENEFPDVILKERQNTKHIVDLSLKHVTKKQLT